jgi:hypothetical protein
MKNKIFFVCIALLFLIISYTTGCMPLKVSSKPGTTTTIILIRHADRDDQGRLTEKGRNRAKALIDALSSYKVTAIYSPNLGRNLDTVRPLAEHLNLGITLAPKSSLFSVDTIAKTILDKHADGVILWVGNVSGNLQAMYRRLGGKGKAPLNYGQIAILTIPDNGEVKEVVLRFDP